MRKGGAGTADSPSCDNRIPSFSSLTTTRKRITFFATLLLSDVMPDDAVDSLIN